MFTTYPTYDRYRALVSVSPSLKGEDVYALQTGLLGLGFSLPKYGADGDYGGETRNAVASFQLKNGLTSDGKVGPKTLTKLCELYCVKASSKYELPTKLVYGQTYHESSHRPGNYSDQRSDGSYDAGVTQRNTAHTPAKDGFDVPLSVDALGANLRKYFNKFVGVKDLRRRWELAAGSWNAPAFACYLARREGATGVTSGDLPSYTPSAASLQKLEEYMESATAFMEL